MPELILLNSTERPAKMIIRAATLSSDPSLGTQCLVANISTIFLPASRTGQSLVCFNRLGSALSTSGVFGEFEDVIFFRDAFHSVSRGGNMVVSLPTASVSYPEFFIRCFHRLMISLPPSEIPPGYLAGRYLVVSRGELLMVSHYSTGYGELTCSFRVYRMVAINPPGLVGDLYMWKEITDLDGRLLFVSRGCSRSFELDAHPAVEEGVYFLDDRSYEWWRMMCYGGTRGRHYPVNDNGHWSMKTNSIQRWPCDVEHSEYSAPSWVVHAPSASS
jgi:hypothetical protein